MALSGDKPTTRGVHVTRVTEMQDKHRLHSWLRPQKQFHPAWRGVVVCWMIKPQVRYRLQTGRYGVARPLNVLHSTGSVQFLALVLLVCACDSFRLMRH